MKKILLIVLSLITFTFMACKPKAHSEFKDIGPNDTAYLIALDGNTQENQKHLKSMEFLESHKVQAKRIIIPNVVIDKCPECSDNNDSKWVELPSAKLVIVSHSPVTRQWTADPTSGTRSDNEAIKAESNESIDFSIAGTATAHIPDTDATKFLYHFGEVTLDKVMDRDIRPFIEKTAFDLFAMHDYEWATKNKVLVADSVLKIARDYFSEKGIRIDIFGFTGGITPSDIKIQDAINKVFEAHKNAVSAEENLKASQFISKSEEAYRIQKDIEMKNRSIELFYQKWDGKLPQTTFGGSTAPVPVLPIH